MESMMDAANLPKQQLPDWMRQAQRGVDWGILLVIGFSLLIAWPFIAQPTLPHTNASENAVYATDNFAAAFQEGRLYPRWSPYVFGGYGAPIPNYYPSGAVYLASLIQVLVTDNAVSAVRIAYILALCGAGVSVYALVRRRLNAASGVLAAFLYLFSPYVGLTVPHLSGDLSGAVALALFPMVLGRVDRLLSRVRPPDLLLVALLLAALCFTHLQMALTAILFAVLMAFWQRGFTRRTHWAALVAGVILGIGIAGCFWIPALLEQPAVRWRQPVTVNSFHLTLGELLTPARQVDTNDLLPAPQYVIGLPGLLFTALGAAAIIRFKRYRCFETLFLAAGGGLFALLVIVLPRATWLLGPIMLCWSVGGSAALGLRDLLPARRKRLLLPAALVFIWILAAPVWLAPLVTEPFGSADTAAQIQYEQSGYGIAVLPAGLPVPATIPDELSPNRTLIEGLISGTVNKISGGQTTESQVRVGILDHNTHGDRFQVSATGPATLEVLLAYFPGWRATLNNSTVPLFPNPQNNLTRITIPPVHAGQLVLELGTTPVRLGAWVIAWSSLGIALILTWGRSRRYRPVYDDVELLTLEETRLIAFVLLCLALLVPLTALPNSPLPIRLRPGYATQTAAALQTRTDAGLSLTAFRLDSSQFHPGGALDITLYWQAQRALLENYRVLLYVLDSRTGARWNEQTFHHPGGYPTTRWNTNRYVSDSYHLLLDPAIPRGDYQVAIEVAACTPDCLPQNRVTFFDVTGRNLGPVLYLPPSLHIEP